MSVKRQENERHSLGTYHYEFTESGEENTHETCKFYCCAKDALYSGLLCNILYLLFIKMETERTLRCLSNGGVKQTILRKKCLLGVR